jgi:hypothetical protein
MVGNTTCFYGRKLSTEHQSMIASYQCTQVTMGFMVIDRSTVVRSRQEVSWENLY